MADSNDTFACRSLILFVILLPWLAPPGVGAQELKTITVDGQPLAENVQRIRNTFDYLGTPFDQTLDEKLKDAIQSRNSLELQQLMDPMVGFQVSINPELRVKVERGPAKVSIQQHGFTPLLVKVLNEGTVTAPLRINSPQAGPRYSGASLGILERQAQTELGRGENKTPPNERFLQVEMFLDPPMTRRLSGLNVEYVIALFSSTEAGQRDATIQFDVGGGTQDIGFRGESSV